MTGVLQSKLVPYDHFASAALDRENLLGDLRRSFRTVSIDPRETDPDYHDNNYRMRAFTDGTATGTNSWAGRIVQTGMALDDRPDGQPDKKRQSTYEMMIRLQINEDIIRINQLISDLTQQAAEFGRLAQEAMDKMHQIADAMLDAENVIDLYRNYQLSGGKLDRRATIDGLRKRNVLVSDSMTDREIAELLERDARKALEDRLRLAEEYEKQEKMHQFYLEREEFILERIKQLEERRNKIFEDPSKSPVERQQELKKLYDEYSNIEIVNYAAKPRTTDGADIDAVWHERDAANANAGSDAAALDDAFGSVQPVKETTPAAQSNTVQIVMPTMKMAA